MEPNRLTGIWLKNVKDCPHRAIPCGNPIDADEAMRARQILLANPDDIIAREQAKQAIKHALKIARDCKNRDKCPLSAHFNTDVEQALTILSGL